MSGPARIDAHPFDCEACERYGECAVHRDLIDRHHAQAVEDDYAADGERMFWAEELEEDYVGH